MNESEKILEIKIKLYRKETGTPIVTSHYDGDDDYQPHELALVVAELEKNKILFLNMIKSDYEAEDKDKEEELTEEDVDEDLEQINSDVPEEEETTETNYDEASTDENEEG
jgi:hypothetical protein